MFSSYMAKYNDIQQHQLSCLSHLRERAQELYNKVQANSWVPQLKKDLEKARLKWIDLAQERIFFTAEVKTVLKLEVDVVDLQKTITELRSIHQIEIKRLHSIHQAEIERKDAFCYKRRCGF